jgi:hypothetical protein
MERCRRDGVLSRRAAAASRRKVIESVDRREVTVCRENFELPCALSTSVNY